MSEMKEVTVVLKMLLDPIYTPVEEWDWHDLLGLGHDETINIIDVHTSSVAFPDKKEN